MLVAIPSESDALAWMIIGGFSAWGGIVRYLMEIRQKQIQWSWCGITSQDAPSTIGNRKVLIQVIYKDYATMLLFSVMMFSCGCHRQQQG